MNVHLLRVINRLRGLTRGEPLAVLQGGIIYRNTIRFWYDGATIVLTCAAPISVRPDQTYASFDELARAYQIARAAKQPLSLDGGKLCGASLAGHHSPDDFPIAWSPDGAPLGSTQLEPDDLEAVLCAAARQDVRYYLNGVLFDGARSCLVASDGHRLHCVDGALAGLPAIKAILPYWAAELAIDIGAQYVALFVDGDKRHRFLLIGPRAVIAGVREIDGKFPDYERIIPAPEQRPRVARLADDHDVGLAHKLIAKRVMPCVELRHSGGAAWLADPANEVTLSRSTAKPSATIGVNIGYLRDALSSCGSDAVIRFADKKPEESSILILGAHARAVVMPMRL